MKELKFNFLRQGKILERGEVYIRVNDPSDEEEIAQKLKDRDFVRCRALQQEPYSMTWDFEPA